MPPGWTSEIVLIIAKNFRSCLPLTTYDSQRAVASNPWVTTQCLSSEEYSEGYEIISESVKRQNHHVFFLLWDIQLKGKTCWWKLCFKKRYLIEAVQCFFLGGGGQVYILFQRVFNEFVMYPCTVQTAHFCLKMDWISCKRWYLRLVRLHGSCLSNWAYHWVMVVAGIHWWPQICGTDCSCREPSSFKWHFWLHWPFFLSK